MHLEKSIYVKPVIIDITQLNTTWFLPLSDFIYRGQTITDQFTKCHYTYIHVYYRFPVPEHINQHEIWEGFPEKAVC